MEKSLYMEEEVTFPVVCETKGCDKQGQVINTITMNDDPETIEMFFESYGHPPEPDDICPGCGILGFLEG